MCELKEQCLLGRGFPDRTLLEKDNNLTSFYTGLPSYHVFMSKPLLTQLMQNCLIISVFYEAKAKSIKL